MSPRSWIHKLSIAKHTVQNYLQLITDDSRWRKAAGWGRLNTGYGGARLGRPMSNNGRPEANTRITTSYFDDDSLHVTNEKEKKAHLKCRCRVARPPARHDCACVHRDSNKYARTQDPHASGLARQGCTTFALFEDTCKFFGDKKCSCQYHYQWISIIKKT